MQPSAVHSGQYAQNKISSAVAQCSTAKPDPFFGVEPNFGPILQVESDQVGPQGQKMSPIGSGLPQIGFKFGFNPIMYLMNPI